MATPPPDLPPGTPLWLTGGLAVVSTVGGVVLAILGLVMPRRRPPVAPPTESNEPEPESDRPRHAQPRRTGTDEVLAMAERQWDRERARYEERIDDLQAETRALRGEVEQLRQEVEWARRMIERFAPRPQ